MKTLKENNIPRQNTKIAIESSFQTKSPLMKDIYQKVIRLAHMDKHLVLIGETGVGKLNLAHAIHRNSSRADGPFHSFYCMNTNEIEVKEAFWEHVHVENEHLLLKYEILEKTSYGILYLNNFSDLTNDIKLSIIDSYIHGCHQLFRYNITASPRLIISISQDSLQYAMNTVAWNKMLAYLDPVSIMLPPLRERREDIDAFIMTFIEEARRSEPVWYRLGITDDARRECLAYRWPGNIRQLKNAIFQGALLSHGGQIQCQHLPFSMKWQLSY